MFSYISFSIVPFNVTDKFTNKHNTNKHWFFKLFYIIHAVIVANNARYPDYVRLKSQKSRMRL